MDFMHRETKWAKQIISMQREDGAWGGFHTLFGSSNSPLNIWRLRNRQYQGIIEPFVFYIDFLTILGYNIPNIVRKEENYAKTRTYERGSG